MKRRNPYTISIILVALGAGLVAYHGDTLHRFEPLTEAEVEAQVQDEFRRIEERRGPHLSEIEGERREALEERLRAEVVGTHEAPKRTAERWFFGGVGALIIALGHLVMLRMMRAS